MKVHLIDGTYELFRHYFAVPSHVADDGREVGAVRGVVNSVLYMLKDGATHVGVATDHVIESFRNDLWAGYKSGAGIDPVLFAQFPLLEEAMEALGVAVWAMVEYEADDALATAAAVASRYAEQVLICTPDKDLGQCVVGDHVVQFDRRARKILDEDAVRAKFGVSPASIPDYLALVGDSADGFPGLPGWGAKSASAVLAKFGHIESIPVASAEWELPSLRGGAVLAQTLDQQRELALLFKDLATLRTSIDIAADAESLQWRGPRSEFSRMAEYLGAPQMVELAGSVEAS